MNIKEEQPKVEDLSILNWIFKNGIVSEKGEPLDFKDHAFLLDILTDWSKNMAVMACAQVGKSVTFNLKALFACEKFKWNIIYCVDEETQALTKNGWQDYSDIKVGDEILTLNMETGFSEYETVAEMFIKNGSFEMVEMKTRSFNALVTPNHRWVVNERRGNKIQKEYLFKETIELQSGVTKLIPRAVPFKNQNKSIYSDDYVKLLAWIFSEGYYEKGVNGNSTRIIISQSERVNLPYVLEIKETLKNLALSYTENKSNNDCLVFAIKGDFSKEIKDRFPNKIPDTNFINQLTDKQLVDFIETSVKADGWEQFGYSKFIQKDKQFIDIFSMACTLANIPHSIGTQRPDGCYQVSLTRNRRSYADQIKYTPVEYSGDIWCPRTKNGTFFARRKGQTYWTGNTMPTDSDVREFVGTKTNRILLNNRKTFHDIQTDNIERKDIHGRTIYFKGTISKSAAISTSADLVIHDEASRSGQEALNTYKSRTKDSDYKGRWLFSNPTVERDTLDLEFQKSDKKEWHITCPHCEDEHYMNFPDSFDLEEKVFICKNCKEPIDDDVRRNGRWIDQDGIVWTGKVNPRYDVSGWHLSHLMATKITAKEIIEDSYGDQEYFHNFVLGQPYNPGDLTVSRTTILDIWTPQDLVTGNYYLGVDVGNVKNYVLGSEKGIIKAGKFTEWSVLEDMMKHYNPKLVIDALPDSTMSKYFVKKYRNALMWYPMENANNPQLVYWYGENDKKGIIYSHRDRSIDMLIDDMVQAKFLIGVPSNKDLVEYIKHFETLRRVKETNAKGIERYVWDSTTGVDHYCFATLYYRLAIKSQSNGVFMSDAPKPYNIINNNKVGEWDNYFDKLKYTDE